MDTLVSTLLITHQHRLMGNIQTGGKRILDVLNDRTTDYLSILDVKLFRSTNIKVCVASYPTVFLSKAGLYLAAITTGRHEAPERRMFSFVAKKHYQVFLTVPNFEVKGRLSLTSSPDPVKVLSVDIGGFFPVIQADISQVGGSVDPIKAMVAFVNKTAVELIQIDEVPIEI